MPSKKTIEEEVGQAEAEVAAAKEELSGKAAYQDLQAEIAALKAQNESLMQTVQQLIAQQNVTSPAQPQPSASQGDAAGWVVVVPQAGYSGVTCGVKFFNGQALVDSQVPGAADIIRQLKHDFGYQVMPLNASQMVQERQVLALRSVQAVADKGRSMAEKMSTPGVM